MIFFVGMHEPSHAGRVPAGMISAERLKRRRKLLPCPDDWPWIMDSGAFSVIHRHGDFPHPPTHYAGVIRKWARRGGRLLIAVSQDYMCEPFMLMRTGMTVAEHQRLSIERYDAILEAGTNGIPLMPVLQGYIAREYLAHLDAYGDRLAHNSWVGVGSLCKRNGTPGAIEDVLMAIHRVRPDLRLHGFGVKTTSLASGLVRDLLYSADSMAWCLSARKHGRDQYSYLEAQRFARRIATQPVQESMMGMLE